MTGPNQPAPRPLPNPGPPPAPVANQPGPGPKPDGPTGPTPTGPGRCDCGHGDLPQSFHLSPCPQARPLRLPALAQIVDDATKVLNAAIVMLGRQWDPTSGPQQGGPWDPGAVEISLSSIRADIYSARHHLAAITSQISARQSTNSASLPGGPFNHPVSRPDEGLTPGLDAGAGIAPEGSDLAVVAQVAGSNHLARSLPRASGGLLPGLVDAAVSPTAGGTGESVTTRFGRDAGGFTVPSAKPWMWSA